MGNYNSKTITQIIESYSTNLQQEFLSQIELSQIQFNQQNKIELYQQYTQENQETFRKKCLEIISINL